MRSRTARALLLIAPLALAAPARAGDAAVRRHGTDAWEGVFTLTSPARMALHALWQASSDARQERVACIGGYTSGGVTYITRVEPVTKEGEVTDRSDSMHASASASLHQCRPPEWIGTVHTHIARFAGLPYVTFSGADRGVMREWHHRWQAEGVFCILYDDQHAYCEAGDQRGGDVLYAYPRGNNLAQ